MAGWPFAQSTGDHLVMLVLKAIAGWLLILVCAVLNGAVREFALVPAFGASAGLALSGLLLCALILVVALAASITAH